MRLELQDHQRLLIVPSHHLAHAHSAYMQSGFDHALVFVADNEGQIIGPRTSNVIRENACERNSYYLARQGKLELADRDFDYPSALGFGKLYNKFTRYLGLGNYHNAGKTMGLASYGSGKLIDAGDAWYEDIDGNLHCIIPDTGDTDADIRALLAELSIPLVPPRTPDAALRQEHADLAEYIQVQLTRWTCRRIQGLMGKYETRNVCISGGVALNCTTNSALAALPPVERVYVPPAPQDQGLCIGNVVYAHQTLNIDTRRRVSLYLGREYGISDEDVQRWMVKHPQLTFRRVEDPILSTARLLSDGRVVAVFRGRSEFGPRALGNRSILADPRDSLVRDRLNQHVKRRELFRPFAPSVLEEHVNDYFEPFTHPSPSMMFVATVRAERRGQLPAITHVDGTARLQTVNEETNPTYYRTIEEFGRLTGFNIVLNTSFNLAGMPIVETPEEAIDCFMQSSLDALVLENFLFEVRTPNPVPA